MAILKNRATDVYYQLLANHVFGRNPASVTTVLPYPDVSQIHASVRWEGGVWFIRDFSRNGSWVNDVRASTNDAVALKIGDVIRFGIEDESTWELIDISPPSDLLLPLDARSPTIKLNRVHALPDEETMEVCIYQNQDGEWIVESNNGSKRLLDGEMVSCEGYSWRFSSANPIDVTLESSTVSLQNLLFYFEVSLDEEHVTLKVENGGDMFLRHY